jgi:hypothetical protein
MDAANYLYFLQLKFKQKFSGCCCRLQIYGITTTTVQLARGFKQQFLKVSYFELASFAAAGDSGGGRSSDFADFAAMAEATLPLLSPVATVDDISSPPLKSPSSREARPDRVRRNIRIVSAEKRKKIEFDLTCS